MLDRIKIVLTMIFLLFSSSSNSMSSDVLPEHSIVARIEVARLFSSDWDGDSYEVSPDDITITRYIENDEGRCEFIVEGFGYRPRYGDYKFWVCLKLIGDVLEASIDDIQAL